MKQLIVAVCSSMNFYLLCNALKQVNTQFKILSFCCELASGFSL